MSEPNKLSTSTTNKRPFRRYQNIRPVVKNLSAPPINDFKGSRFIKGTSPSPTQLIRTLVYLPSIESSSNNSSTVSALLLLSPLPHLRGRSPTKYVWMPETSEIKGARSLKAEEKATLSSR